MIKYIFLTLVDLVASAARGTNDVSISMLTKRPYGNEISECLLMFFENFIEESKFVRAMGFGHGYFSAEKFHDPVSHRHAQTFESLTEAKQIAR